MFRILFSTICKLLRRARILPGRAPQGTEKQHFLVKKSNVSTKKKLETVKKTITKQRSEQCAVKVCHGTKKIWSIDHGDYILELRKRTTFTHVHDVKPKSTVDEESDEMQIRPSQKRGRDWEPEEEQPRKRQRTLPRTLQPVKFSNAQTGQAGEMSKLTPILHFPGAFAPCIDPSETAFVGSTTSPAGEFPVWQYNPPELRYQDYRYQQGSRYWVQNSRMSLV